MLIGAGEREMFQNLENQMILHLVIYKIEEKSIFY